MLSVRCRVCGRELEAHPTKTKCCGCPNMTTLTGDKISALDLSEVERVHNIRLKERVNVLQKEVEYLKEKNSKLEEENRELRKKLKAN